MDNKIFNDFRKFYKDLNPGGLSTLDGYAKYHNYVNPTIIEEREMHIAQLDVFSRLIMERIIYFGNEVNSDTCSITVAQLLYLDSVSNEEIKLFLSSPGGSVIDGFGLLDTIGMIKSDVSTINVGMAASMGSLLLAAGTRGKRKALENSWVMIHELSNTLGRAKMTDIRVEAAFCERLTEKLYKFLAQRCGKTYDEIVAKAEGHGDSWLSAEEAKDFGLIDEVIYPKWD